MARLNWINYKFPVMKFRDLKNNRPAKVRRGRAGRVSTWLALFALVLQTLVPLGQMLQAATSDDTIYICTANGLVPLDPAIHGLNPLDDQSPANSRLPVPDGEDHLAACQVCTAGLFGAHATAPDTVTFTLVPTARVSHTSDPDLLLVARPDRPWSPRAPPATV